MWWVISNVIRKLCYWKVRCICLSLQEKHGVWKSAKSHCFRVLILGYKMKKRVGAIEEFEFEPLISGGPLRLQTIRPQLHITIAITGWIDSKMPGGWTWPLQNARWVNITISKCQVGEHHHCKMPGGWTSLLQNARWVNLTIAKCQVDEHHYCKMPGGWTWPLQNARWMNITIAKCQVSEHHYCKMPGV